MDKALDITCTLTGNDLVALGSIVDTMRAFPVPACRFRA